MRNTGRTVSFLSGALVGGAAGLLFLLVFWLTIFKDLRL